MEREERIGLIAGNGRFPIFFAREAGKRGRKIVAVAFREETSGKLRKAVDEIHWISVGQLSRIAEIFGERKIEKAVMAGQVNLSLLFSKLKMDAEAKKLLDEVRHKTTDAILGAAADNLQKKGITLMNSLTYLDHLVPVEGVLTGRGPTEKERQDIMFGRLMARQIAAVDIGQTVVVKNKTVLAVEAIEGTDRAIIRASRLGGRGITVVKVSKPAQDMRFDVPVVGLKTIELMRRIKGRVLAVEAEKTLILDKEDFIRLADRYGITVVAFRMEGVL